MKNIKLLIAMAILFTIAGFSSCKSESPKAEESLSLIDSNYFYDFYAEFELKSDISHLTENQKEMLRLMFKAGEIMKELFWLESFGEGREDFLARIKDEKVRRFAEINYGPWDRLNDNKPFLKGFGEKPAGSTFYPTDMTKEEFDKFDDPNKSSQYTIIKRDKNGKLYVQWYHEAFKTKIEEAVGYIKKAAELADDPGLKNYLNLRAEALLTDNYQPSDMAWMDMKTSIIDFVVGPIENYEDQLFGTKAAHECYILLKDVEWSSRLAKFAAFLPKMQQDLPVDPIYKREKPGLDADLNAYDVIYYGGDNDAGSKTIAINLPNDEEVQLKKGSRKLQLKNAMQAKFDKILVPIANQLIAEDQRQYINFDAFFANTMFHEVAHGMGIKKVITDTNITVRAALKELYSGIEEGKADILGLYIVTKLNGMGELEGDIKQNYVTFMAGIFRSIRFGTASAHGVANMMRFNYFMERGAFTRNENGTYTVNMEKMQAAATSLTQDILKIQGDGNYDVAKAFVAKYSVMSDQLKADLAKLDGLNIPKDIVFKQGPQVLGL